MRNQLNSRKALKLDEKKKIYLTPKFFVNQVVNLSKKHSLIVSV